MYHKSRYRARKKYYEKEENKEKKRIYMKERYAKKKMEDEVYGQKEKEELNASYQQSLANKKEREQIKNEDLNTINSEGFVNGAQK